MARPLANKVRPTLTKLAKFGLLNIVCLKDCGVVFSGDFVANGSIDSYLFSVGVKILLFEVSPDGFGHKVLLYKVEFAVMLSNIDFSLNVISPTVSSNNWLICGVSLYVPLAMIMLLFRLMKVFN